MKTNVMTHLLEATKDIWQQYNQHPFVKGIAKGDLDKKKFRFYLIQDYLYLQDYLKVYALGLVKAKDIDTSNLFASEISALRKEMTIHGGYFEELKITKTEIENTPKCITNVSYTSYMLRVAYDGGAAEVLAAILSCAYSYEIIAKKILADYPHALEHDLFANWIKGYASESYAKNNQKLIAAFNYLTQNYSEKQIEFLKEIFKNCSKYEFKFWEMAWKMA